MKLTLVRLTKCFAVALVLTGLAEPSPVFALRAAGLEENKARPEMIKRLRVTRWGRRTDLPAPSSPWASAHDQFVAEAEDALIAGDPQGDGTSTLKTLEAFLATWPGREVPDERTAVATAHLLDFAYRYRQVKPPTPPSYRFVRDRRDRSMHIELWRKDHPSNGEWFDHWAYHFLINAKHYHSCLARALLTVFEHLTAERPRPKIAVARYKDLPDVIRWLREAVEWTPPASGLEEIQYYESVGAAATMYRNQGVPITRWAEEIAKISGKRLDEMAVIVTPAAMWSHKMYATRAALNHPRLDEWMIELDQQSAALGRGFELLVTSNDEATPILLPKGAVVFFNPERGDDPSQIGDDMVSIDVTDLSINTGFDLIHRIVTWHFTRQRRGPIHLGPILGARTSFSADKVFIFA